MLWDLLFVCFFFLLYNIFVFIDQKKKRVRTFSDPLSTNLGAVDGSSLCFWCKLGSSFFGQRFPSKMAALSCQEKSQISMEGSPVNSLMGHLKRKK